MQHYTIRVTVDGSAPRHDVEHALLANTVSIHAELGNAGVRNRIEVTAPDGLRLATYGATALSEVAHH